MTTNVCGGCTLCCKVLGVTELEKPKGIWCRHAQKGSGCQVYADRPHSCRMFTCEWLTSNLDPEYRPDRIHGVLVGSDDQRSITLYEDPGWRGAARLALATLIQRLTADGIAVVYA